MGHDHYHRQKIDYHDAASRVMTIVTDKKMTIRILLIHHGHCYRQYIDHKDAAPMTKAIVTENTLNIRMLLHVS